MTAPRPHWPAALAPGFPALLLRVALAAAFLAAVSDRFGLWGPPGTPNVAWGDFARFEAYTAKLNPYLPNAAIPFLAWTVTVLETSLSLALLLGLHTRTIALASGALLLAFAAAMTHALGIKAPLNGSVYSASAGAFLLASVHRHVWALDNVLGRRRAPPEHAGDLATSEADAGGYRSR